LIRELLKNTESCGIIAYEEEEENPSSQ